MYREYRNHDTAAYLYIYLFISIFVAISVFKAFSSDTYSAVTGQPDLLTALVLGKFLIHILHENIRCGYLLEAPWRGLRMCYTTHVIVLFYGEMEKIAPEKYSRIIVNYSH